MKALVCTLLFVSAAIAEPMHFEIKQTAGKCCNNWIQATGEITGDTPRDLEAFLSSSVSMPKVVRLNSEGGSLRGGVMLGELFRARGFATEVGSSKLDSDVPIADSKNVYIKTPGSCSSSCAMAFLGGVERTLDPDSSLAFHVVANRDVSEDDLRELTTLESLYLLEMGVDTRLIHLLIEAGPNVMRGIRPDEARTLRVTTSDLPPRQSPCLSCAALIDANFRCLTQLMQTPRTSTVSNTIACRLWITEARRLAGSHAQILVRPYLYDEIKWNLEHIRDFLQSCSCPLSPSAF
jgi:hypothetical protein